MLLVNIKNTNILNEWKIAKITELINLASHPNKQRVRVLSVSYPAFEAADLGAASSLRPIEDQKQGLSVLFSLISVKRCSFASVLTSCHRFGDSNVKP